MIQTHNISKSYRSGRGKVQALSDVSISIPGGVTLAVVGKSGSGKTTLLNCIGGLERPDNGSVNCFGVDIHTLSRKELSYFQRRNMGFVFQFGNLLSYLTVFENIEFPRMVIPLVVPVSSMPSAPPNAIILPAPEAVPPMILLSAL